MTRLGRCPEWRGTASRPSSVDQSMPTSTPTTAAGTSSYAETTRSLSSVSFICRSVSDVTPILPFFTHFMLFPTIDYSRWLPQRFCRYSDSTCQGFRDTCKVITVHHCSRLVHLSAQIRHVCGPVGQPLLVDSGLFQHGIR